MLFSYFFPFFFSLSLSLLSFIRCSAAKGDDDDEEEPEEEEEEKPKSKKRAASTKKPAAAAPAAKKGAASKKGGGSSVLAGVVFALSGKLSAPRPSIQAKIEGAGGKVAGSVTKAVQYLITTSAESGTEKVEKAKATGVHIVNEDFLNDCLEDGEIPSKLDAYTIE